MENIGKLREDNHFKWLYDMQMLLKAKNLWKNVQYESLIEYIKSIQAALKLEDKDNFGNNIVIDKEIKIKRKEIQEWN